MAPGCRFLSGEPQQRDQIWLVRVLSADRYAPGTGLPGWLRLIVWLVLIGLWALASIMVLRPPADQDTRLTLAGRSYRTRKFHNVQRNPNVALVIDDVLPPWRPRCVLIRGTAEALAEGTGADGQPAGPMIRLHPSEVISWGMEFAAE